jgi:deoxyinosine 3'endonuclease (endonuclease V)
MRESQPLVDLIQEYQASHPPESFPQVFLVDGNGRLHDREAGLATAVGVLADVPTIGVAKEYYPLVEGRDGIEKPAVQPDNFRSSQKGFREVCRKLLLKQGDWTSILDAKGEQTLGAVCLSSADSAALFHSEGPTGHLSVQRHQINKAHLRVVWPSSRPCDCLATSLGMYSNRSRAGAHPSS